MISTARKLTATEQIYVAMAETMLEDAKWGPRIEFVMHTNKAALVGRLGYGGSTSMKAAHQIIKAQRYIKDWLQKADLLKYSEEEAKIKQKHAGTGT